MVLIDVKCNLTFNVVLYFSEIADNFPIYPVAQTKYLGDSAYIQCEVSSLPAADVIWLRHGHAISNGDVIQITPARSQLTLTYLTYEDTANYRCMATNPYTREIKYSSNSSLAIMGR